MVHGVRSLEVGVQAPSLRNLRTLCAGFTSGFQCESCRHTSLSHVHGAVRERRNAGCEGRSTGRLPTQLSAFSTVAPPHSRFSHLSALCSPQAPPTPSPAPVTP